MSRPSLGFPRAFAAGLAAGLLALFVAACSEAPSDAAQLPAPPSTSEKPAGKPPVAASGTGFDFYVLSLAWSPTFCAEEGADAPNLQCGTDRDFAFIVHGLWPQFERGYPEFCRSGEPNRVPDTLARQLRDIMPSPGLVGHQWRKHGTCTGLSQPDFVKAIREAYDAVKIPPTYRNASRSSRLDPDEVEADFREANPGMPGDAIAVTCASGRLDEVRICLNKDLGFRGCAEVGARACRASSVFLPAAP